MTTLTTAAATVSTALNNYEDANDYLNAKELLELALEGGDVEAKIQDDLECGFYNVEIIGYCQAAKYLLENDPSFNESLELASEFGYSEVENLKSEILASLHACNQKREDYSDFSEIVELIEELAEELTED